MNLYDLVYLVLKLQCTAQIFIVSSGGSRLMRISLLRISILRFFKKFHKFALCIVIMRIFFSLVQFFGLFLANAHFFQNQKSLGKNSLYRCGFYFSIKHFVEMYYNYYKQVNILSGLLRLVSFLVDVNFNPIPTRQGYFFIAAQC